MVVPFAARCVAAAFGALLVLTIWQSVIGTLIVPRPVASWLTRLADRAVVAAYHVVIRPVSDYRRRDRILATQASAILLTQLVGWLASFLAGFTLMLWPLNGRSITQALTDAGSSIFTLGFAEPSDTAPAAIVFFAAATGMVVVALQIGYLPTLYAAFNRRETEVALLNARAGVPAWGPELLARTSLRARHGRIVHRHAPRPVPGVGALVGGRGREPHHLPAAGPLPLAAPATPPG